MNILYLIQSFLMSLEEILASQDVDKGAHMEQKTGLACYGENSGVVGKVDADVFGESFFVLTRHLLVSIKIGAFVLWLRFIRFSTSIS